MKLPSVKTLMGKFSQEPPLGWAQLSHQKARLLVALSGIAFADILIFMQLGFKAMLFDGATLVHNHIQGDLVLISNRTKTLLEGQTFSRRHLYQAAAVKQWAIQILVCWLLFSRKALFSPCWDLFLGLLVQLGCMHYWEI